MRSVSGSADQTGNAARAAATAASTSAAELSAPCQTVALSYGSVDSNAGPPGATHSPFT